jgi:putative DNA primase/helicase
MVALIVNGSDNRPVAVHRTYLDPCRPGKADVSPNKLMLGPCRGGAVRLGGISCPLLVGEGIETCLAAMQVTGLTAWAALSTSGMITLNLPLEVADVIVLADGDAPGERAAVAAAERWTGQGRRVRIARPPLGLDFNDVLRGAVADADGEPA